MRSIKYLLTLFFLLSVKAVIAQEFDAKDITALEILQEQLVLDYLECLPLTVKDVSISTTNNSFGAFSDGTNTIGIDKGLVFSTGRVSPVNFPHLDFPSEYSSNANLGATVADLFPFDAFISFNIYNYSHLQIEFIPEVEKLFLEYVFASEEFSRYQCSRGDDIMGIIINGPGYEFNPAYGGELISLIPDGSGLPIRVGNIHEAIGSCPAQNTEYYRQNDLDTPPIFDGYTTVFKNELNFEVGSTYDIQFLIADEEDWSFDSGLFFKMYAENEVLCDVINPEPQTFFEACSPSFPIDLNFDQIPTDAFPLQWELLGTASFNEDYLASAVSGQISSNTENLALTLDFVDDGINEPIEEIILRITDSEGNQEDLFWFLSDPLEELQLSRAEICGNVWTNVFVTGDLDDPESYTFSEQLDTLITSNKFEQEIVVDSVPFNYLASSYQIESVCIRIELRSELSMSLVSPNGSRAFLFKTNFSFPSSKENLSLCFSPEATYNFNLFQYNPLGEDVPYAGSLLPTIEFNRFENSPVNGNWTLLFETQSSLTNLDVNLLEYSLTLKETKTPNLPFVWESDAPPEMNKLLKAENNASQGDFYTVEVELGNCSWKDSMAINLDHGIYLDQSYDVCYGDTLDILGERFYVGKERKLFIFENDDPTLCDSLVNVFVNIVYPSVSYEFGSVPMDSSYAIFDTLLEPGWHQLVSDELNADGCDSIIFVTVIEEIGSAMKPPPVKPTEYVVSEEICDALVLSRAMIEGVGQAIFYEYQVSVNNVNLGPLSDYAVSDNLQETVLCFRLDGIRENGFVKRFNANFFQDLPEQYFTFSTQAEFVDIIRYSTFPDHSWKLDTVNNELCSNSQIPTNANVLVLEAFDVEMDEWGVGAIVGAPNRSFLNIALLPITPGDNEIILTSSTFGISDTIHYFYESVLPSGGSTFYTFLTEVNSIFTWDIAPNNLCGPIIKMTLICEDDSNEAVDFQLINDSLQFHSLAVGEKTACVEICDSLNICDTLNLTVTVEGPSGVNDLINVEQGVKIYPNPTSALLHLETLQPLQSLQLFDTNGRLLSSYQDVKESMTLDLTDLPAGIYLIQGVSGTVSWVEKIVLLE